MAFDMIIGDLHFHFLDYQMCNLKLIPVNIERIVWERNFKNFPFAVYCNNSLVIADFVHLIFNSHVDTGDPQAPATCDSELHKVYFPIESYEYIETTFLCGYKLF